MRTTTLIRFFALGSLFSILGGSVWFVAAYGMAQLPQSAVPTVQSLPVETEVEIKAVSTLETNSAPQPTPIPEVRVARTMPRSVPQAVASSTHSNKNLFQFTPEEAKEYAALLKEKIPYTKVKNEGGYSQEAVDHQLALLYQTLQLFPKNYTASLRYLTLDMNPESPRGLGGAQTIIMRGTAMSDEEFVSVFVHELGHIVDLGYLKSMESGNYSPFKDGHLPVLQDDPSAEFYGISWANNTTHHSNTTSQDFVSGYGKTDPFEDFAESFLFYVAHGNTFKAMAQQNQALQQKYQFLQTHVFDGVEFTTGTIPITTAERAWDGTKRSVDLPQLSATLLRAQQ